MQIASVVPLENGSVTVQKSDKTAIFQLTFEFPTYGTVYLGYTAHFSSYGLGYSHVPPEIEWINQQDSS
jgi:hypothetical protein